MQPLDIIFCAAALIFLILGIKRGLSGEIVRLLAMVGGFIVAFFFYLDLYSRAAFLHSIPQPAGGAVAFLLLYIVTALLIIGAGWVLKQLLKLTPFGIFDKILGGVVGLLKICLIAWVACLSISTFSTEKSNAHLQRSVVFKTYERLPSWLHLRDLTMVRRNLKKSIDKDAPKQIEKIKGHFDLFKAKVDSAEKKHDQKHDH
jgi:membrane protein required for colicin V production